MPMKIIPFNNIYIIDALSNMIKNQVDILTAHIRLKLLTALKKRSDPEHENLQNIVICLSAFLVFVLYLKFFVTKGLILFPTFDTTIQVRVAFS